VANDLLLAAIRAAGLDPDQIADTAGVDPRTAQRWLGGRIPHPRYRQKLAAALHVDEAELWPETAQRQSGELDELIGAVSRRSDPGAPDWRALLGRAEHNADLLGYSLLHIAEARTINKTLAGKARAGCQIRIAIADPTSPHIAAADRQQQPPGRLVARVQTARERLEPLVAEPGIDVRLHRIATTHTVLRFDDHLLLTIHL
jgi:transcriptional regulator with XRE-family HTH domain